jgi:type I restriction enzyme, S subunit
MKIYEIENIANINYGTRVVKKRDSGTIYDVYGGGGKTFKVDSFNRENCVIVSRFGMSEECVRRVDGKFFLNDSGLSVETKNSNVVIQKYIDWFLFSKMFDIYLLGRGAAQKNLDVDKFRSIKIPIPSLQEQEEIVERLDKESALIAKRTNLNFITLINNLFSSHVNDIVKELYENSPKVAVQDEIYTSDYVANGSFKSLKDNVNTTNKPSFALLVKFNDLSKSKNLKKTYIDESSYNFLKKSNLYEGDLIINNVGANLGKVFIVPNLYKKMSIGPNCIIMKPSNSFLGEYLQIVMNSHYFQTMLRKIFGGAAQPKFNKTNFRSLMLPFIDLDKQNEIVSEIKKIEEIKNKLINNQQQIYIKLLELKKSVLNKEFSYE